MPELRHLRYFVAVAQELHFGRAAERLHIAQPGLSQQIRALERDLGVELLRREKKRVELTDSGAAFYAEVVAILKHIDRAVGVAREVADGTRGRLRLSYARSAPGGICARIVDEFRRRYPEVRIDVGSGTTLLHVEQVRSNEVDVAFVRLPIDAGDDVDCLELGSEPLVVALPANHSLGRKRHLKCADVRNEPFICFPRALGPRSWDLMLAQIWGTDLHPNIVRMEPINARVLAAVAEGAGVAVLAESRAAMTSVPGVIYRHFEEPAPSAFLGVIWNKDAHATAVKRFVSVAGDVAAADRDSTPRRTGQAGPAPVLVPQEQRDGSNA